MVVTIDAFAVMTRELLIHSRKDFVSRNFVCRNTFGLQACNYLFVDKGFEQNISLCLLFSMTSICVSLR